MMITRNREIAMMKKATARLLDDDNAIQYRVVTTV